MTRRLTLKARVLRELEFFPEGLTTDDVRAKVVARCRTKNVLPFDPVSIQPVLSHMARRGLVVRDLELWKPAGSALRPPKPKRLHRPGMVGPVLPAHLLTAPGRLPAIYNGRRYTDDLRAMQSEPRMSNALPPHMVTGGASSLA